MAFNSAKEEDPEMADEIRSDEPDVEAHGFEKPSGFEGFEGYEATSDEPDVEAHALFEGPRGFEADK
jgi:hypothetical protein